MYCPQCRVEYRDGFTECPDCHVPVLGGTSPPETADRQAEARELLEPLLEAKTNATTGETEGRFQMLADSAPIMIWMSGRDGKCTYLNKRRLDFTGRGIERELGDGWSEGVHPDDLPSCLKTYQSSFAARRTLTMEYRLRRADGEYRWVMDNGAPLYSGGEFEGFIGSCVDVTERKLVEEQVRASERRLINAQRLARVGSWERYFEAEAIYWSDEMFRIFGLPIGTPAHFLTFLTYIHPDDREKIREADRKALSSHGPVIVEYRINRPDGKMRFVRSVIEVIRDDRGALRTSGATQDVTDQVHALEELRKSEERLRNAQRLSHVGNWDWDIKANRLSWSDETARIFGQPPDYAPTYDTFLQAAHPDDRDRLQAELKEALASSTAYTSELRIVRPDGDVRMLACTAEVVRDETGLAISVSGASHDITDRKRAEQERAHFATLVEKQHERLNAIISSIPGAVWETWGTPENPAKEVRFMSQRAEDMLGYKIEQWTTPPGLWPLIVHPDDRSRFVRDAIEIFTSDKGSGFHQYRCLTKDGRTVWLESHASAIRDKTGKPTGLRGVTIDISERKETTAALMRAQEELARVSRAITMGEVAASIAHEINQPLSAVVTNGEVCLQYLAANAPNIEKAKVILNSIIGDSNRASEVIQRIRALFARTGTQQENFDLNQLIQDTALLLQEYAQRHNVIVRTHFEEPLSPVFGDPTQLRQVLLNLVRNGIEASEKASHEARLVVVRTGSDAPSGVRLEVSDSGVGIQPGEREKIFHPFFTTKEGGLGMGLSISRTIVESHGGRILVEPNEPHGTKFLVLLPNKRMA